MKIEGIHYGLTLMYSYLLPFFEIKETSNGFIFAKKYGVLKGLKCTFHEDSLLTICDASSVSSLEKRHITSLLGLDKTVLFKQLSSFSEDNLIGEITLMFSPLDAENIFKTILLSRNTDYFTNTIRWVKDLLEGIDISRTYSSYIPKMLKQFNEHLPGIDFLSLNSNSIRQLLEIRHIGAKTVSALLLHGYGNTLYAPVDRHFSKLLSLRFAISEPLKKYCMENAMECLNCRHGLKCKYGISMKTFGDYNGVIQSISYIASRLERKPSELESILLKNRRTYKRLTKIVKDLVEKFNKDFSQKISR
ncbi:hypothetical protein IMZ38_06025 [Thermosphaera chiliense]|uniref:HhH-GPD family protein n=1 Tax=Thermosphaera chiliense TaxID=3402707 RepID=A0A7M1USX3_9CREN|nr:hypothetical protein [Thermosphaera aggregans]QOR94182.1 hypothetical protein IMZ38_06025 [Thermosphaera aggregans]